MSHFPRHTHRSESSETRTLLGRLRRAPSAALRRGGRLVRRKAAGAVSVFLIICLLSGSTPAAPRVLSAMTAQLSADTAYMLRGGLLNLLAQAVGGDRAPGGRGQEKQQERNARVSRIEISPGDVTLQVGQRMIFAATAFDSEGAPVGGVHVKWKAKEVGGRKQNKRVSPTGVFVSPVTGEFTVTAEAVGARAEVTVKVVDEAGGRGAYTGQPKPDEKPISVKEVSTSDPPKEVSANSKKDPNGRAARRARRGGARGVSFVNASYSPAAAAAAVEPAATPAAALVVGQEWDDSNYMAADDPGNVRGDPTGQPAGLGAGSGNFQMSAPVLDLPGRAIDLKLSLTYNSQVWSKSGSQITYDIDQDWPAPGWSLGFGRLIKMGTSGSMIVDADGTRHGYTGTMNNYSWGSNFTGYTTDSTFIDYYHSANAQGVITYAYARYPNGMTVQYGAPGRNAVYPTQITDANGNYITITYRNNAGPNIQTVTDTLGRTVNFHYDYNNLLTAVTGPGLGGGTRTLIRLHYRWMTLGYSFYGMTAQVRSQTVPVVDAIYYPATRTGYWFGDADSYSSYGMIAKVQEQRSMGFSAGSLNEQGWVSPGAVTGQKLFNYPMSTAAGYQTGPPSYTTQTETWAGMDTAPAVTTYSVQQNTSPRTITVTQPDGSRSVNYSYYAPNTWYDGLSYQDELYDAGGRLWRRSNVTWQQGAYASVRPVRNETLDELGQVTAEEFSYGPQYNQVTEVRSYGFGGYELLRRTVMEYDNSYAYTSRHIFSLVTSSTVYDRDGWTRLSRTEYQYDGPGSSLAATPGVTMHDASHDPYAPQVWVDEYCYYDCRDYYSYDCYYYCDPGYWQTDYNASTDYRGNVTRVTKYADAASLAAPVVEARRYDVAGNVVSSTSSCCEETRDSYGVDTQYAYPTSNSRGSSSNAALRNTTRAAYDFNTGLLLTSTDANGRASSVEYAADSLRPTFARLSTGAYTAYVYNDDQTTVTETLHHYGGAVASTAVKTFNGRGQVSLDQAQAPGGAWDSVATKYDQFGRIWKQSAPYRSGQAAQWTENFYDPLGRGVKAVGADASVVETFYNESSRPPGASAEPGLTKRSVDSWGRERWERADASGRLVEVAEPNAAGAGSVFAAGAQITRYRYDTLGNLVEVTQGSQQRRFRYDALGRMTHQKLAEAAATLNDAGAYVGAGTWSHVFGYDDRNLVWQVDARGARTSYAYDNDPLNRLKTVSYSTAGVGDPSAPVEAAPTIRYEYATAGDLTRLARVVADGVSTEDFAYDGEGRPLRKTLTLTSRPGYPMAVEYTYNSLNKITDVRYPAQYGAGGATKYVHYDFDAASRLTALKVNGADYGSQGTYNADSQMTSLLVGPAGPNQIQETYAYDAQTGYLTGQRVVRNGAALLDLSYDHWGAAGRYGRTGQIKRITNNLDANKSRVFDYDALGRLVKASNGSTWTERYTYDRFGNRTSVTSSAGLASAPTAQDSQVQLAYDGTRDELPAFARRDTALSVSDAAPLSPLALARPPQPPLPSHAARARAASSSAQGATQVTGQGAPERPARATAQPQPQQPAPTPTPAPQTDQPTDTQSLQQGLVMPCEQQYEYQLEREYDSNCPSYNTAPYAYPGGPYSGQPNQAIQFDGTGSWDNEGWVTNYIWNFGDGTTSALASPSKAYAAAGTYTVTLQVRDNGGAWSSVNSTTATVTNPTPVNGAAFVSHSAPSAMTAGQQYAVSVTMRNTGTKTWTAADQHRLGSQNPQDNATWGFSRVGVPASVAPGGQATFTFNVTAPASPGTYNFQWRMVQDGVEWFGDYSPNVAVTVTQPAVGGCSGPAPCDGHPTVSYDPASNRVNSPGWLYDAAGNQIRAPHANGTWQRFVYDAAGRLVRVTNDSGVTFVSYKYGSSNERLVTQEGGDASNQRTYQVWDSGKVVAEFGESNASPSAPGWRKNYYYMGNRLLATQEPNAGSELVYFHHPDHLGTRLVSNMAGGAVAEQTNLPFGNPISTESAGAPTNRRFTSYERNAASGLDYALNRHYDAVQGRFTQVDPLGLRATNISDPQTLNLYAYCGNDPVNNTDPDGLFFGKLFKGIGKLFKGVAKVFGKVVNAVGKALSYVGTLMSKVLHNRWFVLGITLLSIIFPPAWVIYQAASKLSFILQATGLALQGKWKELVITLAQAAIQWAINKALSFVLDKIHMAMGVLQRLSECAKNALSTVFDRTLLDRLRIYTVGWLWARADAWTFGNNQYYLEGNYDERTPDGLALVGHETKHSRDFAALGMFRFIYRYISASLRFDYFSKDHPFEQPARDIQGQLAGVLSGCAGGNHNARQ